MVGALKQWLGINELIRKIATLESENLRLAKFSLSLGARVDKLEADAKKAAEDALKAEKALTPEPPKPKIAVRSKVNWKNFRSAAERASDPEEQEA